MDGQAYLGVFAQYSSTSRPLDCASQLAVRALQPQLPPGRGLPLLQMPCHGYLIGLFVVPVFTAEDTFWFKVQGKSPLVPFLIAEYAVHFCFLAWRFSPVRACDCQGTISIPTIAGVSLAIVIVECQRAKCCCELFVMRRCEKNRWDWIRYCRTQSFWLFLSTLRQVNSHRLQIFHESSLR